MQSVLRGSLECAEPETDLESEEKLALWPFVGYQFIPGVVIFQCFVGSYRFFNENILIYFGKCS